MEDYKEIVKYFNKIFETKIYIAPKELPLLTALYRRFKEDLYIDTPKYNEVKTQKNKQGKLLEKMFNYEQQKAFEKYWELQNEMQGYEEEQQFLYGYLVAKELEKEKNRQK